MNTRKMTTAERQCVSRISVSLPENLLPELDVMVKERGFQSRSQAIVEMINCQIAEHKKEYDENIMAGTINLVYDGATPGLQALLFDLQRIYINEVISSLNVNLENAKTLQVILVQGPAKQLKTISDRMIACRGVLSGNLLMSAAILPPIHPLPQKHSLEL